MKYLIFLLSAILFINCHPSKEDFISYGFKETKKLSFTSLDIEESIYEPHAIEVFDSLLLLYDPIESINYTIINLNTLKPIIKGIQKGEGPNDILYGAFIDKIGKNKFQIVDQSSQKILVYSIDSIIKNKAFTPIERRAFKDQHTQPKDQLMTLYIINDSTDIGLGLFENGKYSYYQKDSTRYFGEYPKETLVNPHPFYLHQGVIQINNDRNYILYHSPLGYYYELLSIEESQLKKIFTEYKPIIHVDDATTEETKHGICSADFTDEKIFLLYSGRTRKEYPNDSYFSKDILTLKYDGTKSICYKLDKSVLTMSIDSERKKIYVVAQNDETKELEIGYYMY